MRNIIIFQGMLAPNVVNIIQRQRPSSYRMTVRNMYTNATHHARVNIVGVRARACALVSVDCICGCVRAFAAQMPTTRVYRVHKCILVRNYSQYEVLRAFMYLYLQYQFA